jgi:hypothetical protein
MGSNFNQQAQSFLQLLGDERLPALTLDDQPLTGEGRHVRQDRIQGELCDFERNFYTAHGDFTGNGGQAWVQSDAPQSHQVPPPGLGSLPPLLSPTSPRTVGLSNQGSVSRKSCHRSRLSSLIVNTQDPWCPVAAMNPRKYRDSNRESCWRQQKNPSDLR